MGMRRRGAGATPAPVSIPAFRRSVASETDLDRFHPILNTFHSSGTQISRTVPVSKLCLQMPHQISPQHILRWSAPTAKTSALVHSTLLVRVVNGGLVVTELRWQLDVDPSRGQVTDVIFTVC